MYLDRFESLLLNICPDGEIGTDFQGQLIFYTGKQLDDDDVVINFEGI